MRSCIFQRKVTGAGIYDKRDEKGDPLRDGSEILVGRVRGGPHHTPGHTHEHLRSSIGSRARGDDPVGAFTGDFVFVGDVETRPLELPGEREAA